MKPALFWTLRRGFFGWELLGVTTRKGDRLWGRNVQGEATNATARDCAGRFDSQEAAQDALLQIADIRKRRNDELDPLQAQIAAIWRKYQEEEDRTIKALGGGRL